MTAIFRHLERFPSKNFRTNYSAEHKTFIAQHIVNDIQHPLNGQRRREQQRRKQEGLWWHITTSTDLSKSSVVRTWCRRRLHNAFADVLKKRGIDEYGRLVDAEALESSHRGLVMASKGRDDWILKGSFRFHALVPCIPAKYADLQKELGALVDAMLKDALQNSSK
ncbi:hypothetical protein P280DRAFT_367051, partial [Massarina eburnea CBS 473.64]